jgi:hypothetical protein
MSKSGKAKLASSIGNWFGSINGKIDDKCCQLEKKMFGDTINNKMDAATTKATTKVKEVAPKVKEKIVTPFKKVKEKTDETIVVKAMATTKPCWCKEEIPLEAAFCPMCGAQHVVPNAKPVGKPVTSSKVIGIGPTKTIEPTKKGLFNKLTNVFKTPMVNVN